jgi:hypothetical protein
MPISTGVNENASGTALPTRSFSAAAAGETSHTANPAASASSPHVLGFICSSLCFGGRAAATNQFFGRNASV